MKSQTYIKKDPTAEVMRLTDKTETAVRDRMGQANYIDGAPRVGDYIAKENGSYRVLSPEQFAVEYTYSRTKNDTQAAVWDCYEAGLSRLETGEALGLSYTTVRKHYPEGVDTTPGRYLDKDGDLWELTTQEGLWTLHPNSENPTDYYLADADDLEALYEYGPYIPADQEKREAVERVIYAQDLPHRDPAELVDEIMAVFV